MPAPRRVADVVARPVHVARTLMEPWVGTRRDHRVWRARHPSCCHAARILCVALVVVVAGGRATRVMAQASAVPAATAEDAARPAASAETSLDERRDGTAPPPAAPARARIAVHFASDHLNLTVGTVDAAGSYHEIEPCAPLPCDVELPAGRTSFGVRDGRGPVSLIDGERDVGPGRTRFDVRHQSRAGVRAGGAFLLMLSIIGGVLGIGSLVLAALVTGDRPATMSVPSYGDPSWSWPSAEDFRAAFVGLGVLGVVLSLALGGAGGAALSTADTFDVVRVDDAAGDGSASWDE